MGAALGLIGIILAAFGLHRSISGFRRAYGEAELLRVAALPQQSIRVPVAGDLRLFIEGPKFRTWHKRLSFALQDAATGQAVPVAASYSGTGVRGWRRSRVERGRIVLSAPGTYLLSIGGLTASDPAEYAIVIMRPFTQRLLLFVLSCVFLGMVLIGSLVLAILSLALG